MASVKLRKVKKVYDNKVVAVHDFNLDIADKEFIVFVGPSGCGKSTTLRMIAGLEEISEGKIEIDDVVVNDLQPKDRGVAMVFQNYALYPHLTVYENMAFALRLQKVKPFCIFLVLILVKELILKVELKFLNNTTGFFDLIGILQKVPADAILFLRTSPLISPVLFIFFEFLLSLFCIFIAFNKPKLIFDALSLFHNSSNIFFLFT